MHLTQHFLPINNCCLFFSWSFLENTQKPWMRTIIRTIWPATTATKNWWPVATSSKTRTLTASRATRNCTPTTVKSARNRSGPITRWVTYWDWLKSKVADGVWNFSILESKLVNVCSAVMCYCYCQEITISCTDMNI